ncbi:MAG: ASPIC/UnbV domain-containing protein [Isosphaeraceae bacterium]|nr:ASPIC/UnbV domain-containing protein [Isosphaeraceae bacterium]
MENPWDIVSQGHNLSAYERDKVFLNLAGKDFVDISFPSGADSEGDGRCAVAADFRNTGQLDVLVRQVSGGAVTLYENLFPQRHYLKVSLRGSKSNKLGLGARLTVIAGGLTQTRELYPINTFLSQAPSLVHFGLGDAADVERLTIRWPSGTEQTFRNLSGDRHVLVDEGKSGSDAVQVVLPGRTLPP